MIYPSAVGTLTCVESLEMFVRVLLPPYPNDYFVLVRMVRLCVLVIKLPNPIRKLAILKVIILVDSEIESMF
jgi:hypothetical protein